MATEADEDPLARVRRLQAEEAEWKLHPPKVLEGVPYWERAEIPRFAAEVARVTEDLRKELDAQKERIQKLEAQVAELLLRRPDPESGLLAAWRPRPPVSGSVKGNAGLVQVRKSTAGTK